MKKVIWSVSASPSMRRDDRGLPSAPTACKTLEEVANYTKAGGGCSACHEKIEDILIAVNGRLYASQPTPGTARSTPAEGSGKPKLTNYQRIRKIEETLEAIRPMLQRDHGDVTLVEVDGKKIYVELTGACRGCAMEVGHPGRRPAETHRSAGRTGTGAAGSRARPRVTFIRQERP
jgi:hypothetical protein